MSGAVADAYAQAVLPACQGVTQDRYPFIGAARADAAVVDVLRVFGMGGVVDGFTQGRLKPLMDTAGPVWRWRDGDPVAAALNPASPEAFAKAGELRDLLAGGLPIKVAIASFGAGVGTVEIASGGTRYRFTPGTNTPKPLIWSATGGLPEAGVILYGPVPPAPANTPVAPDAVGPELARFVAEGPWALFRVMDQAERHNTGPTAFQANFGEGAASAAIAVALPGERNPFGRGGLWSFRCPATL